MAPLHPNPLNHQNNTQKTNKNKNRLYRKPCPANTFRKNCLTQTTYSCHYSWLIPWHFRDVVVESNIPQSPKLLFFSLKCVGLLAARESSRASHGCLTFPRLFGCSCKRNSCKANPEPSMPEPSIPCLYSASTTEALAPNVCSRTNSPEIHNNFEPCPFSLGMH